MNAPTSEDDRRGEFTVSRVVDAPSDLVWRAFTEPERLAAFWDGPAGSSSHPSPSPWTCARGAPSS